MDHRDAELSDVVVVLTAMDTDQANRTADLLRRAGLEVSRVDDDQCVVEGTIDAGKVNDLRGVAGVTYVRTTLTYTADYPAGDPRDQDGPEADG